MYKKMINRSAVLITATLIGVPLGAAPIYDGSTDALYKATSDNATMALANPSSGTYTLTNGSASTQGGYVYGNFAATSLADGESLTLAFTINNAPAITPLNFGLSGARGVSLVTGDQGLSTFPRSYAGFTQQQNQGSTDMDRFAWSNGPAGATTADGNIAAGVAKTSMDDGDVTLGGSGRFNTGSTADITLALTRVGTQFRLDYTLNVSAGGGVQSFQSALLTPSGNEFGVGDSLTTFSIGYLGSNASSSFDSGETMQLSNISVTAIPEPSSLLLMGLAMVMGVVGLRRRKS